MKTGETYPKEIVEFIKDHQDLLPVKGLVAHLKRGHREEAKHIISLTSFLNERDNFSERLYCILNNIRDLSRCIECKNKYTKYKNI